MDRELGFYYDFSMRKNILYHYDNGSSSNAILVLDMVTPYVSKYSSHLQPRSHGTCNIIDWHVGTFFCVDRALDMSCFVEGNVKIFIIPRSQVQWWVRGKITGAQHNDIVYLYIVYM